MTRIVFKGPTKTVMLVGYIRGGWEFLQYDDSLACADAPWRGWAPRWYKRKPPRTVRGQFLAMVKFATRYVEGT